MLWLSGILATALAGETTIEVPQEVDFVRITCGSAEPEEIRVSLGKAVARLDPSKRCKVDFIQSSGELTLFGDWTCTPEGCQQQRDTTPVEPGQVRVTLTAAIDATTLELTCRDGYRMRTHVEGYQGNFEKVPEEDDCTIYFKGGAPGQFHGITPGSWICDKQGAVSFCKQR